VLPAEKERRKAKGKEREKENITATNKMCLKENKYRNR
jgi:hypothetical protein